MADLYDTPVERPELGAPAIDRPPAVARRFLPVSPIGAGGLCTVWEAEDLEAGGLVAVKLAHQGRALSDEALARFQREARMLAGIEHPNVVRIIDYGVDPELGPFLAMERLHGPSLWQATSEIDTLPLRAVIGWLAPIGEALDTVHGRGLVHRDVKPHNMVRAEERPDAPVKLVDFGLVAHADGSDRVTKLGQVVGTPHYIAPEVAEGASAQRWSDVYSLAVVAFELLTGKLPHRGESPVTVMKAKIVDPAPSLYEATGKLFGLRLEALFSAALDAEPRKRPGSAGSFIEGLRAAAR
jgi:serine/threonine protein kinase